MIKGSDLENILRVTKDFWKVHVNDKAFREIASGKEIGHRIADYVDETTSQLLAGKFRTGHQKDKAGRNRTRSMGDIWIFSNNMFNPVNVKAGLWGDSTGGQPNLVSLNRVLTLMLSDSIDSYYLLIVKMKISNDEAGKITKIEPRVYLVDMLDHLEYVTFNSGPGQLMLKERQFNEFMESGESPDPRSIREKISIMIDLREEGDKKLFQDRKKNIDKMRKAAEKYMKSGSHKIDQGELNIG
jgi:hypothetical protein